MALDGLFIRSSPERRIGLDETRRRIERVADRLAPLAEEMSSGIIESRELDLDAYSRYCKELAGAGVYTEEQTFRVAAAEQQGLLAKAIGGLQAKALLVIGDVHRLDEFADDLPEGVVLGRLAPPEFSGGR